MTSTKAKKLIKSTKGKFFSCTFIKKDGSIRHMTCRISVKKGVKGVGLSFSPEERGYYVVWDTNKKQFRMINLNTILKLKVNGIIFK